MSRLQLCEVFGLSLGLSSVQVRQIIQEKPSVIASDESIVIGRVSHHFSQDHPIGSVGNEENAFSYTSVHAQVLQATLSCLCHNEPVLLLGDTGTGKTTLIQHLTALCRHKALVYNFSDQSESSDLIGRTIPEDASSLIQKLKNDFTDLLHDSRFLTINQQQDLCTKITRRTLACDWAGCVSFCGKVADRCVVLLTQSMNRIEQPSSAMASVSSSSVALRWVGFQRHCANLSSHPLLQQHRNSTSGSSRMIFRFEEGILVKALREGHWLILDEINLAPSDVLQRMKGLLNPASSEKFVLSENDGEEISPHPNFRLFACMNPPMLTPSSMPSASGSKVRPIGNGKKELPQGIRQCFTEIFVDEVSQHYDLEQVISRYLPHSVNLPCQSVADFYLAVRSLSNQHIISDGAGKVPHFSLRTLVRATRFATALSTRTFRSKSPIVCEHIHQTTD